MSERGAASAGSAPAPMLWLFLTLATALTGCATPPPQQAERDYYGTLEPFIANAVYFVLTDRFVNGDPANDQREQGGAHRSFDRPTPGAPAGQTDNLGYLGGDFRGVLDNADYLRDLGFSAVWVTPIVDNPDEAFTGGEPATWGSRFTDRGKTGFHGYWGVNFFRLDEHLPSTGLNFAQFTAAMRAKGLKTVLDIVANHGSPAWSMPVQQPQFGQIYGKDGQLLADHQNLPPEQLDPAHNPLHRWYHTTPELLQLSNIDEANPAVLDYFVAAYSQWLDQGADAFRIDTIRFVSNTFWKAFTDRIRAHRPGLYMFAENFDHDPNVISAHTWPENGAVSVLDFPLQGAMNAVFSRTGGDYAEIEKVLFLQDGPYANPYDLATFYDNHDMARMDASDAGFIDAHNFLFTARGMPVVYYGSETGFMRGTAEHAGNRNYFGQARIAAAPASPIFQNLKRIANVRATSPALQRGLMLPIEMRGDRAVFYRVWQYGGESQLALVILNKGDREDSVLLDRHDAQPGRWHSAIDGRVVDVAERGGLQLDLPPHEVEVLVLDGPLTAPSLRQRVDAAMQGRLGRRRYR